MGGFTVVVQSDIMQIIFIIFVFISTFFYLTCSNEHSVQNTFIHFYQDIDFNNLEFIKIIVFSSCFTLIGQDMGQRCFAAKSPKIILTSSLIASLFLILISFISLIVTENAIRIGSKNNIEIKSFMGACSYLFGKNWSSFFAASIVAAILSTVDSLLSSINLHVNYDILPLLKLSSKQKSYYLKFTSIIIGVLSLIVGWFYNDIISLMVLGYELFIFIFFTPMIISLYSEIKNKKGIYLSISTSFLLFIFSKLFDATLAAFTLSTFLSILVLYKDKHKKFMRI